MTCPRVQGIESARALSNRVTGHRLRRLKTKDVGDPVNKIDPKWCALLAFALSLVLSGHASAEQTRPGATVTSSGTPLVHLDLTGGLRLRGQWIDGGSLLTSGSSFAPSGLPASLRAVSADKSGAGTDRLGVGDLRLRLQPVVHVGSRASIHGQVDVAGTMVMGSDRNQEGLLDDLTSFGGNGPVRQALAMRRLWARVDMFGVFNLEMGRMGDHFGLGMLRNDGRDEFADFQSEVDRIAVSAEMMGFRGMVARDSMASLPVGAPLIAADSVELGLQDATDVLRWVFQVHGGQLEPTADGLGWGLAFIHQSQELGLAGEHSPAAGTALGPDCLQRESDGCVALVPRDAALMWSQAHLRYLRTTAHGRFHAEVEVAALYGTVANSDILTATDTAKTLISGGIASRLAFQRPTSRWSLDAGFASGEAEGGFGVFDQDNFKQLDLADQPHRSLLTGFRFHRGFLVDGLLFREIIGAVANTWYVRPAYRQRVLDVGVQGRLDLELGVLGAVAASREATPGRARVLGVEPELRVDLNFNQTQRARMHVSYLIPGAALAAGAGAATPESAWRASMQWMIRF